MQEAITLALRVIAASHANGFSSRDVMSMAYAYTHFFLALDPSFPAENFIAACRVAYDMSCEVAVPATVTTNDN